MDVAASGLSSARAMRLMYIWRQLASVRRLASMGVKLALVSVDAAICCFVFANTERAWPAPKIADIHQLAGELYAANELLLAGMSASLTQA